VGTNLVYYPSQSQGGIPPADDSTGNATCSGW